MDRGVGQATVHGVTELATTERLHFHFPLHWEHLVLAIGPPRKSLD